MEVVKAFEAVRAGDLDGLRSLLAEQPEVARARDGEGISLLMTALYHRRAEMVEAIRSHHTDLDLLEAAAAGAASRLRQLLDAAPQRRDVRSPDGFTPLHLGAFFAREEVVAVLVERGADIEAVAANRSRVRPLHSAAAGGSLAVVQCLLAAGAEANARQAGGITPLMGAAVRGDVAMVRALLAAGAEPRATTDEGRTAEQLATERGHPEMAVVLGA